ncbi:MAG: glycosyltransferase family 4 protein [Anaerolineae bacterium]
MRFGIDGRYIRDSYPGIGRYAYHLFEALLGLESDDEWWVLYDPAAEDSRFSLEGLESREGLHLVPSATPVRSWREQAQLPRLLADLALDLFHTPFHLYPYLTGIPSISTVHDVIPMAFPSGFSVRSRWIFRIATQLALWRSRRIIAPSKSTARALDSRFAGSARKIAVIREGVDARFRPVESDVVDEIRSRHRLPERYYLSVGIDSAHKNLRFLVETYARLGSAPPLALAGAPDPRYTGTRRAVEELGLADRVIFLGAVAEEDLPGLYSGAEVFLHPSLHEGFGLPVLEAMASGAPVICSDASSLPEVVGDAGTLIPPDDSAGWSAAIERLSDDPELREWMAQQGLVQAGAFTWRRAAVETRNLYDQALDT